MRLLLATGLLWLILSVNQELQAQTADPPSETGTPTAEQPGGGVADDLSLMRRTGSSMSRPAEFQGPGLLQVEWGFDESFHGPDLRSDLANSVSAGFAVNDRLLIEFGWDSLVSQTDWDGHRNRGVGDSGVGVQMTVLDDRPRRPALAFVYFMKLPSASVGRGLGTGKIDQKVALLVSKVVGSNQFDFNVGFLVEGHDPPVRSGRGSLLAVSVTRTLSHGIGVQGEFAQLTLDSDLPRGSYGLTAITWQARPRLQLDGGARFGLTRDAPRIGIFTGLNFLVGNLYRRQR